jgi:hypothetical protein
MGSPFRALTDEERKIFQAVIDGLHGQFVGRLVESQKLPLDNRPRFFLQRALPACKCVLCASSRLAIRFRVTTPRRTFTTTIWSTTSSRKSELMIGIPFLVNLQDRAMTETMGPIYDRTQEQSRDHRRDGHLRAAPADRRRPGAAGPGRGAAERGRPTTCRVHPASVLLPEGESWVTATEKARQSDAGVPIARVPFAS